jgi:hypothetical protein
MQFRPKSIQRIFIEQSGAVEDPRTFIPSQRLEPVNANDMLKGLGIGKNRKERQARIAAMARDSKARRK